jgi:serine/threonine protein kinase
MAKTRSNKKYKRKTVKAVKAVKAVKTVKAVKAVKAVKSLQYKGNSVTPLNEKFNGLYFFRKYNGSIVEPQIYRILHDNPHPHIVKVYRNSDNYVDIELLQPVNSKYDEQALISAAHSAKAHLQSLGIMYIDWKPDNMGLGADGKYKLFDFDMSGIVFSSKAARSTKKYLKIKSCENFLLI